MRKKKIAVPVLAAAVLYAGNASAVPIEYGDFSGSLDSTLSLGAAWRMESRDASLVSVANGGTSRTSNDDDGNLGYDRYELTSATLKGTHDLEIQYEKSGLFSRVTYFYNPAIQRKEFPAFYQPDGSARTSLGPDAENRLVKDLQVLDLFAFTEFEVAGQSVGLRIGNQVINWGESAFIGNGINSINPVDVAKLRTPGSEIKEALIPSPIVWASMDLAQSLKLEALWMSKFSETKLDPRGSYFSTNDIISDDGDKLFLGGGRRNDQHQPYAPTSMPGPNDDQGNPTTVANPTAQSWIPRDGTPDTHGKRNQYGFAVHYFADELNNSEFGLFFLNYQSRNPILSFVRGGSTNVSSTSDVCTQSATADCRASYFSEYPDDIHLFGLSFNTGGPYGTAIQGEYSYRPNQPIQLASTELVLASLGLPNNVTGTGTQDTDGDPNTAPVADAAMVPAGTVIHGFRRVDMHQMQLAATKAFGPTYGAEQFTMQAEVGVNYLDLPQGVLFAGPGAILPAPGSANTAGGSFQDDGYATSVSWGYRVLSRMDFENVIDAVQLSPRLVFSHDVHGVGPNFNQGAMALQAALGFNYLQRWQADIGYTAFLGGRTYAGADTAQPPAGQPQSYGTSANPIRDRDFLAVSISFAF